MKKLFSTIALTLAVMFLCPLTQAKVDTTEDTTRASLANVEAEKASKVSNGDYVLVTSKNQLVIGRKVIIVASSYNYAVSATQSYSNRSRASITRKTSDGKSIAVPSSSVGVFTLGAGSTTGTYSFYDSNYGGYLCSASSYYNYLKTTRTLASNSSFTISFKNGVANITANYYNNNKLKYNSSYGTFACYYSGQKDVAIYQQYVESADSTVKVTGVSLNTSSTTLAVGETKTLTATVAPSNATNKTVTWNSSNTSVATVSNGKITAVKAGSTTITVTTADGGYTASSLVTVTNPTPTDPSPVEPIPTEPTNKDAWTIMIYICGADLESKNSLATSDLKEILSVTGQPNDVNIIIQTGGANSWASTYGINASYSQRYHVENNKLVKDANLTRANMGLTSTFQSFLEWGLTSYPAEKTGVVLWNHGGAMRGVCYDENYSDDSLLNSEVNTAFSNAFANTGRTQKLEFIGYDACLMNVQDIAQFNSNYFNYMIASEESESGYGWDYDTWVDDLYRKSSTPTILKAIVDGFIKDNGGTSSSSNNQTLSYLNLAYMDAYMTAWENMAKALTSKLNSSNKSSFNNLVKSCKHYSDSYYVYYGIFDAKDFVNKLSANSTFNPGSTYTNEVLTNFSKLVEYSSCGRGAGNSNGMCMFWSVSSNCGKSTYYTASQTNFTNWRSLVSSFGA